MNIWLWNHYATSMYFDKGGRHYWFAENLVGHGHRVAVFCASTIHNSRKAVDTAGEIFSRKEVEGIPFVFVRTPPYDGNGSSRLRNMAAFYRNLFPAAARYAARNGRPDVIIASSVHPLTLVAGIKIARKFGVPCVCEVRDLWPESIVAYGIIRRKSIIARVLYHGEKWIYRNADAVIMTWEGGREYIINRGWSNCIDISRVYHISNGVQISKFDSNSVENQFADEDLDNPQRKTIVYAGSIRKVNNLGVLLDAAKIVKNAVGDTIVFLVYGDGDESEALQRRAREENITNLAFKGRVERKFVPCVLKKAHVNILHNSSSPIDRYGQSQNKFFEYLAAGRCIIQTYSSGYSIINRFNCGVMVPVQSPEGIARAVLTLCSDDEKRRRMGENARQAAAHYDFEKLTDKLLDVIETVKKTG